MLVLFCMYLYEFDKKNNNRNGKKWIFHRNTYYNIATRNIFDCTKISDAEYFLGGVNDPKQCHIKLKTYVHTFSIFCVFFLYIKIFIYIFLLFVWAFTFLAAVVSYCFNWENTPFYTRAKLVIIKMMMRMTIR